MRGKQKALRGAPFFAALSAIVVQRNAANTKPNGADVELSLLSVLEDNNGGED
jgi:hypothetical protein